jgi:RNA polymerase sigma factor (sigma-70 family)
MPAETESRTGSVLFVLLGDLTDRAAWHDFVERYGPNIYGWCRKWGLQEADAQDVTQNVLIRLVRKLHQFHYDPTKGKFRGWLRTVTQHAWSDYLEIRRETPLGGGDSTTMDILQSVAARADLQEALAESYDLELLAEAQARVRLQVTPRDWQIFQSLALEGRAGPDVAHELDMKVTAVLMAKSRVQKKLRDEVRRLEDSSP